MVIKVSPSVIGAAVFTTAASVFFCIYFTWKNRQRHSKIPTKWRKIANAKQLLIYPLKSGHYKEVDSVECTEVGFRTIQTTSNPLQLRDRSFVVYGNGEAKSCKGIPKLVHIEVSVHDRDHIALDAPQMRTLYVKIPEKTQQNTTFIKFWTKEQIETTDCGDEASRWLSNYIAQKDSGYNLGYYHDPSKRRSLDVCKTKFTFYKYLTDSSTGLFSDLTSFLLLNQKSVLDFLKRAPTSNVTSLYFRPNIIVDDPNLTPYEEDNWDWLKIGDEVILRNVKACTRCVATLVDPVTGERHPEREPLKTLSSYRISEDPKDRAPVMGIHLETQVTGVIKVGDPVYLGYD